MIARKVRKIKRNSANNKKMILLRNSKGIRTYWDLERKILIVLRLSLDVYRRVMTI